MPKPKPKPQARGLAEGLRIARKASKLAMVEVAEKLQWSQSTLSRIETGVRNASAEEVSALLAVYQVTGEQRDSLIEMARDVDRPNWLETRYSDVPNQAKTLAQFESDARRIVDVGLILIPGLLQTASYTRSLMNSGGVRPADIQARVDLRIERQKVLAQRNPPHLVTFIDEAALRRRIGGARVMADQLRHLVTVARRSSVELRVIPFDVGGHPGVNGAYVLLEFADARPVVHLEHRRSGVFLHQAIDVDPYVEATASMNAIALEPMQSVRMVEVIAESYD
ncbi:helix-turn-helix domain-containing protein [Amycolatopsis palatopharyngis]|uniref:helix-turn-helix domain-containing protein n=1 Tax=Amycolatopsis palatopharyngis TaxID=187982 RepID=UPI000E234FED|nr:helix-turn-helix transcriptional regulator [Amycolatopsis palatopharyngis]